MNQKSKILLLISSLLLSSQAKAQDFDSKDSPYQEQNLLQKPKLEKLFNENHAGTEYQPIKLEANMNKTVEINLETVLAKAVQNNLNLNIARSRSHEAKWKFWQKVGKALPDLSLQAGTRNLDGTTYFNSEIQAPVDERISTASFRIDYRIFDGGTTSFLAWSEKLYKDSILHNEKSTYNKALLDSYKFYNDLLVKHISLSSKLKAMEQAKANLELSEKFETAGNGTKYDVMQAEARLARTQTDLIQEEADFRAAQIALAEHLNEPLETAFVIAEDEIEEVGLINHDIEVELFMKEAYKNNPDILSAVKLREAAYKNAYSRVGDFLPKLDFYVDMSGSGEEFGDLFTLNTVGFNASYEIGEGLGLTPVSKILESRNSMNTAKYELQLEKQRIEKELRFSYINFQRSKSFVFAAEKELLASREANRIAQLRYKNGLEIFNNLIEKEVELTKAELNLLNSIASYNNAQADLAYYMGAINVDMILKANQIGKAG